MQINAYAKINLGLDIIGKREDGYHEMNMVMQTIGLKDVINIEVNPETMGSTDMGSIMLTCSDKSVGKKTDNLAYKAAMLLYEEFHITDHLDIDIQKNIPVAAGLGGGSADAAAVLKGLNEYLGLDLSNEELAQRAVKLGADVPFCIYGGTAGAMGIGENLMPLMTPRGLRVVLAVPEINVSTKEIFEEYDRIEFNGRRPDIDNLRAAIEMEDIGCIPEFLGNVLESVTIPKHPVIGQIKDMMMHCGAAGALMSGSGPAVYGLFVDDPAAEKAVNAIENFGLTSRIYLTEFVEGEISPEF